MSVYFLSSRAQRYRKAGKNQPNKLFNPGLVPVDNSDVSVSNKPTLVERGQCFFSPPFSLLFLLVIL